MKEETDKEIEGYISIAEAAKRIGVHAKTVHNYIEQGRLKTLRVANTVVVLEESVKNFKKKSEGGRPRTHTPIWRRSPDNATFIITAISVRIRKGKQGELTEQLEKMRESKQYLFPGTIARYISEIDEAAGTLEIQLLWKQNEMPDEDDYREMVGAFGEAFAKVLDWSTVKYTSKTVLLHT
jgi:excisionase family DNA binding protein